jgi:predicted Zn-dependent protease
MSFTSLKFRFWPLLTLLLVVACSTVPVSGRRQVNLLPESTLIGMSLTAYADFLGTAQVLGPNNSQAKMVNDVGQNIVVSVNKYLANVKQTKRVEGFQWEFQTVDDPTINAWCMPGGKVVFYTGILPICEGETGVAVVMGHEIAHAVARHGNERMSQGLLLYAGGASIDILTSEKPGLARDILLQSYGIGSVLGTLAYSRNHESEADKMGLIFMAMAGYDPREAVEFWKRMGALGGAKPPELLSTHPSDETRVRNLEKYMPEALKYYKPK